MFGESATVTNRSFRQIAACFIVRTAQATSACLLYFEDEPQRQMSMKRLKAQEYYRSLGEGPGRCRGAVGSSFI